MAAFGVFLDTTPNSFHQLRLVKVMHSDATATGTAHFPPLVQQKLMPFFRVELDNH